MNVIDMVILTVTGFFCVKGIFKGLILEVFTLAGLILGYLIALREMSVLANWISRWIHLPPLLITSLSFLLIFMAVLLLVRWLASLLKKMVKWTMIGWLDRLGGGGFGLFKGTLIMSLVVYLISLIPLPKEIRRYEEESVLFKPVRQLAPAVFNVVKYVLPQTQDFYEEVKESWAKSSDDMKKKILDQQLESLRNEVRDRVEQH